MLGSRNTCGRDVELADLVDSRWDILVAAGSGPGWSRAIYLIASNDGVSFNVLCGSHVVADRVDAGSACDIYNRIGREGVFFAVIHPQSQ